MPRRYTLAALALVLVLLSTVPAHTATETTRLYLPQVLDSYPPPYPCDRDTLNCDAFPNRLDAQRAFEFCLAETGRDSHRLDGDNDLCACECNADPGVPGCPRSDNCRP